MHNNSEIRPKISIIMATYNSQGFLEESILSAMNQTFKDFELLIVDDCSTDKETKNIINNYAQKDPRIKSFFQDKNQGAAITRNIGLQKATGDYIAILDSDDISLPNRLEVQFNFMENNPDYFLICSSFQEIDSNGKILNTVIKEIDYQKLIEEINFKKIKPADISKIENCLFYTRHSSFFFKNTKDFFYRDKLIYSQDTDLFLRIFSSKEHKIKLLKDVCVQYRIHDRSITSQKLQIQKEFGQIVRKWFLERISSQKDSYEEFDPIELISNIKIHNNTESNQNQRIMDSIYFNKEKSIKEIRKDFLKFSQEGETLKTRLFFKYAYLKFLIPKRIKDALWNLFYSKK